MTAGSEITAQCLKKFKAGFMIFSELFVSRDFELYWSHSSVV